jgi:uncharacterized membrane protein YhaH (DUF805 family)
MTFGDSVSTCLRKYVDFNGRASRSEYWWFFLFGVLLDLGASMLSATTGTRVFFVLSSIAVWVPLLTVAVRRLHDAGMSGWWWFTTFIPIVGLIVLAYLLVQRPQPWDNKYGAFVGEQVLRSPAPAPQSPVPPASMRSRLDGSGTP